MALDIISGAAEIDFPDQTRLEFLGGLARLCAVGATAFSKTSYGLALLRLMSVQKDVSPHRKLQWLIWFLLVSVNIILWPAALVPFIRCRLGLLSTTPERCWGSELDVAFGVGGSGYSGASDVVLALLPLETILGKLRGLKRFGVLFAMSMGFVAAVAAFTQCSQIPNIDDTLACELSFSASILK